MIILTKLRNLDLATAAAPGRPAHLSAASGLVRCGDRLYVVADDDLSLGVFDVEGNDPGILLRLLDGTLPDDKTERKKRKPDFEVLTLLPARADYPDGALLALGSGSTPNRRRGVLLGLDREGAVQGSPHSLDLSRLYARLGGLFPEPNIEGAVIAGGELRLFQRGNNSHPDNAIVRFSLEETLASLAANGPALEPLAIQHFDLGSIDGVPLCFTDAVALNDGAVIFTAVAEDTDDAYNDGACLGACVGMIDASGAISWQHRLDRRYKVEGIAAHETNNRLDLLLVTDADDPAIPGALYAATVTR